MALVNGIPFISLTATRLPGGVQAIDGVTAVLVGCLLFANASTLRTMLTTTRIARLLVVWAGALAAWWLLTLGRTTLFEGVSVSLAALYGRDFLYFAVLVTLLYPTLRHPGVLWDTAIVLALFAAVASSLEILSVAFGLDVTGILNVSRTTEVNGVGRLYVPLNDLITLTLPCALGVGLFAVSSRTRAAGWAVAALCLTSVVVQLTRAVYLGLALGCVLALTVWLLNRSRADARRRLVLGTAFTATIAVALVLYLPTHVSNAPISGVSSRVVSSFTAFGDASDTLSYRANLRSTMYQLIGDHWFAGLGFVHPRAHYYVDLPLGELRNTDVGVLGVVATMGVVGALLMLSPIVYLLGRTLLLARGRSPNDLTWLHFGFGAWASFVLVTSPNLVVLFSQTGVGISAFAVAAVAASLPDEASLASQAAGRHHSPQGARSDPLGCGASPG